MGSPHGWAIQIPYGYIEVGRFTQQSNRDGDLARIRAMAQMGKFWRAGANFTTSDHIEFRQIFLISIF